MSAITAAPPGADESTLAEQLLAHEPGALSAAYQAYGERLFDYAMGMLGHREAAEDVVHDALLVASHRIGTLHRAQELPLWLYALVRNECLRQMRRGRRAGGHDATTVVRELAPAPHEIGEQARRWVRDAAAALPTCEREALDLASRHGLTETEIAAVLRVPAKRAATLIRSASTALERTLDTLFTSRAGHGCADLDGLLVGWDGGFSVPVRDKVGRHMASCAACAPITWDSVGAVEMFAELPAAPPPRLLERRLLATAAVPSRVASRADIAEPFERDGYPVPLDRASRWRPTVIAAGVVATVALAAAGIYLTRPDGAVQLAGTERAPIELPRTLVRPSALSSASAVPLTEPSGAPGGAQPGGLLAPAASASADAAPSTLAGPPTTKASAAPPPSSPPAEAASKPPSGPAQVDALLADSTTGCGMWWQATATAYVRGATARDATLRWGASTAVPNSVPMHLVKDGMYQATATGLPVNVTVFWHVIVVTTDGRTIPTTMATIKHERQC